MPKKKIINNSDNLINYYNIKVLINGLKFNL